MLALIYKVIAIRCEIFHGIEYDKRLLQELCLMAIQLGDIGVAAMNNQSGAI